MNYIFFFKLAGAINSSKQIYFTGLHNTIKTASKVAVLKVSKLTVK